MAVKSFIALTPSVPRVCGGPWCTRSDTALQNSIQSYFFAVSPAVDVIKLFLPPAAKNACPGQVFFRASRELTRAELASSAFTLSVSISDSKF